MNLSIIVLALALLVLQDIDGSHAARAIAKDAITGEVMGDSLVETGQGHRSVRSAYFPGRRFGSMFSDFSKFARRFRYPFRSRGFRPSRIFRPWGTTSYHRPQRPYRNLNQIEGYVKKYAAYVPLVINKGKVEIPDDKPKPSDSELTTLKTYCSWYPSLCEEVALDVMSRLPKRIGKGKEMPKPDVRPTKSNEYRKVGSVKEISGKPTGKVDKEKKKLPTPVYKESTTKRIPMTTRRPDYWRIYSFEASHRKPISELFESLMGYIFGDRKESIHAIMEKFVKKYSKYVTMVYDGSHLIRPHPSNSVLNNLFRCCGKYPDLCDEVIKTTTVSPTKPAKTEEYRTTTPGETTLRTRTYYEKTSGLPSTTLETEKIFTLPESSGDDLDFYPELPSPA